MSGYQPLIESFCQDKMSDVSYILELPGGSCGTFSYVRAALVKHEGKILI